MFEAVEETHPIDTKNRVNPEKLLTHMSGALHALFQILLTTFLQSRYYYYLHFAEVEFEVRRDQEHAPGNNILNVDPGFKPGNLIPESQLLTAYQQKKKKINKKQNFLLFNCLWDSMVWYGFISLRGFVWESGEEQAGEFGSFACIYRL